MKLQLSRCRSAFKLLEMNQKHEIIKPGYTVIDCGAAPGSWSQIAAVETNSNADIASKPIGFVIGIDLLQIYPIKVFYLIQIAETETFH